MNRVKLRIGQRGESRSKTRCVVLMAVLVAGCSGLWGALSGARAQIVHNQPPPSGSWNSGPMMPGDPSPNTMEGMMAARSRMQRNVERQKHLVSDTDRLVALANELKLEVARSGSETLTPEMQHKIAEIEKLARSVKDKMRE
jgi:hypothetical protein